MQPVIKEKVERCGLHEKVIFLGQRDDVYDIMQAIDVFVFPSKFEGLGIVLIEAQYSNLPCVVSSVIPDEAKISSNFYKLKLDKEPIEWAKNILNCSLKNRKNIYIQDSKTGYDIRTEVEKLEIIYTSIVEGGI